MVLPSYRRGEQWLRASISTMTARSRSTPGALAHQRFFLVADDFQFFAIVVAGHVNRTVAAKQIEGNALAIRRRRGPTKLLAELKAAKEGMSIRNGCGHESAIFAI